MEQTQEIQGAEAFSVQIFGKDADGVPFLQPARVREVDGRGAQLDGIVCRLRTGDVIGVKCSGKKGLFRVISVYVPAIDLKERMVGVVNLEPSTNIWGEPGLAEARAFRNLKQ